MTTINDIEGIGEKQAAMLKNIGISSVEKLLERGASAAGRKSIAEDSGISESKILEWVNRADLYRIKGVGSEFSDLLEVAGVDSVPELAQRNPDNLYEKLVEINEQKAIVRQLPGRDLLTDFIDQAKKLSKIVTH